MPATRAHLIWNPVAGRRPERRRQQVEAIAAELVRGGWQIELAATTPDGGAGPAAGAAVRSGCDVILGCGGDGTLHEIVNAVMTLPPPHPALGVVAFGTANILAHATGCAVPPRRAAAWLLQARPMARPLGMARPGNGPDNGQRYFLAVTSAGLDAQVVHTMTLAFKRRWGKLAYAGSALAQARRYFPAPIEFECGATRSSADGIILGLSRYYGGRLKLG
ncbi:MAG: diacylglycerol/lipid kinase family protein, partial [Terriglobales bacterium]